MSSTLIWDIFFVSVVGIQVAYWSAQYRAWLKISSVLPDQSQIVEVPAVSVVICGKDEAENIRRYLTKILQQDYPEFEVVFVDDDSRDDTAQYLKELQSIFPQLVVLSHQKDSGTGGKKGALASGIAVARHGIILLTDADCYPQTDRWIWEMTRPFQNESTEIVLGYGPYEDRPGLLNKFIRFETTYTAISYLGFAQMGLPYMGVGRNLAYRKNIFLANDGFKKHAHIAAGDDDLFVNAVALSQNTAMVVTPEAWVYSVPKLTWKAYLRQKMRHISVSKNYRLATKILLGMINFSQMWIHLLIIILLILKISTMFVVVGYILCLMVKRTFYGMFFNRFHNLRIIFTLPLLDFLLSILFITMSPTFFFRKLHEWK